MITATASPAGLDAEVVFSAPSAKVVPAVFVADTSSSMSCNATDRNGRTEPKSQGLQRGLGEALDYLRRDPTLCGAARVNVVTFNSQVTATGFQKVGDIKTPSLQTAGNTHLKAALQRVIRDVEAFAYEQNAAGVNFTQTTIMLISDGEGTDGPCDAEMRRLLELQEERLVYLIGAGIDASDAAHLTALGFPTVVTLDRMTWTDLIQLATVTAKRLACGQAPIANPMNGGL